DLRAARKRSAGQSVRWTRLGPGLPRLSGERTKAFTLPAKFAITNLNAMGALEISGNTAGRVTNKGMEGLAITPDGKTLVGADSASPRSVRRPASRSCTSSTRSSRTTSAP
ncbi:MAG TPA: esterase-like activity of phytase family protein, partial [Vicinamibacterales bacterium]